MSTPGEIAETITCELFLKKILQPSVARALEVKANVKSIILDAIKRAQSEPQESAPAADSNTQLAAEMCEKDGRHQCRSCGKVWHTKYPAPSQPQETGGEWTCGISLGGWWEISCGAKHIRLCRSQPDAQSLCDAHNAALADLREHLDCMIRTNAGHMDTVEKQFNKIKDLSKRLATTEEALRAYSLNNNEIGDLARSYFRDKACAAHKEYDSCCPFCRSGVSYDAARKERAE